MSDPQPARRSGIPLLEVGVVALALVGIAVFIWWGLEKSRETARRGVAKAELKERGFTLDSESNSVLLQISGRGEIDNKTLNLLCVLETAGPLTLSLEDSWLNAKQLERLSVLRNLHALVIDGSRLTDDDLALLSSFPNLEYLSLRQSLIQGPGLQHLQKLQKLSHLDLADNELTDDCREHLLKLGPHMAFVLNKSWMSHPGIKSLRDAGLDVWFNAEDAPSGRVNDFPVPVGLENGSAEYDLLAVAEKSADGHSHAVRYIDHPHRIPSFRWLRLSGIRLLTSELELLEHWHNLEFLDLTSLHIAGVTFYQNRRKYVLPGLANMPKLTTLSLAGTGVGDHAIRPLSKCGKLKYLDLRMTDLHGEGLKALSDLRGLEVLRLSHNMIEDDSLAALTGLTSLKRLELDSTDITDEGLTHLRSLTNLEELSTSHTRVTKAAAEQFQKQSGLRGLTTFREYDPKPKLQTGPALRPLIGIGDGSVGRAVNKRREAPYTEELIRRGFELTGRVDDGRTGTLVSTRPVTDNDLRFASRLLGLKSVSVSAAELTPVGVWYLKRLPELESLTLTGPDLSTELFSQIPELTPLRNLTLRECDIDDTGLQLIAASSTLKSVRLELSSDSKLSEDSLSKAEAGGISIKVVSPEETSPTSIAD